MHKTCAILILSVFAVIQVAKCGMENRKFVFPSMATKEDVELLDKITSKQALPVVVFESHNGKLRSPVSLTVAEIKDRRLASGTLFFTWNPSKQLFLCPNPDTTQRCLAPHQFKFDGTRILECEHEPIPSLVPSPTACGPAGTGTELLFGYSVCPAESPYTYRTTFLTVFSMCYNKEEKKLLHTDQLMTSPALLSQTLLIRERQITFEPREEIFEQIPLEYFEEFFATFKAKPQYQLQYLVPPEDMPLATSRKLAFNFANYGLQHEDLVKPWNKIRSFIRNYAEKLLDDLIVMTGVFDIPKDELSTDLEETEIANIWVTLVLDMAEDTNKGVAILMNNFTTEETKYIDKICKEDLSAPRLIDLFDDVGGQVRCCKVTTQISNLFVPKKEVFPVQEVLQIPNIVAQTTN